MHIGDLLQMVADHPDADIARYGVPDDRIHTDLDACMKAAQLNLAILCCATADHASMTERLAPHFEASGGHLFVEKLFAASADDARRVIAAMNGVGPLAINWPLA